MVYVFLMLRSHIKETTSKADVRITLDSDIQKNFMDHNDQVIQV